MIGIFSYLKFDTFLSFLLDLLEILLNLLRRFLHNFFFIFLVAQTEKPRCFTIFWPLFYFTLFYLFVSILYFCCILFAFSALSNLCPHRPAVVLGLIIVCCPRRFFVYFLFYLQQFCFTFFSRFLETIFQQHFFCSLSAHLFFAILFLELLLFYAPL